MSAFDIFWKKEKLHRKTMNIDSDLYDELQKISDKELDASINKLVNAAILELLKTKNITTYERGNKAIPEKRTLLLRTTIFNGIAKLSKEVNISQYKLVNIAIKNAISEYRLKR